MVDEVIEGDEYEFNYYYLYDDPKARYIANKGLEELINDGWEVVLVAPSATQGFGPCVMLKRLL